MAVIDSDGSNSNNSIDKEANYQKSEASENMRKIEQIEEQETEPKAEDTKSAEAKPTNKFNPFSGLKKIKEQRAQNREFAAELAEQEQGSGSILEAKASELPDQIEPVEKSDEEPALINLETPAESTSTATNQATPQVAPTEENLKKKLAELKAIEGSIQIDGEALKPEEEIVLLPPTINITVAVNKMAAYVKVGLNGEGQKVGVEEILAALEAKNIVYGINEELIQEYCQKEDFYKEIKIASGLKPIQGKDGTIDFYFKLEKRHEIEEDEHGRVDFKNMNLIQNMDKDSLLCSINPPIEGTDGIDVFNIPVGAKEGLMPTFPKGKNTYISEDGLQLFAAVDGCIEYANNILDIEEIYRVSGDVGPLTGNIDFNGSVTVVGNVLEGFKIEAVKDVVVKGMVEGANIISGGNVLISDGFNGMYKGIIQAEGDITSSFVENGVSICGGNFQGDVILNSEVKAGKDIILKGRKGALVKGKCIAGQKISVKTIGTNNSAIVDVTLKPNWYDVEIKGQEEQVVDLVTFEKEKNKLKKEMAEVQLTLNKNKQKETELNQVKGDAKILKQKNLALKQLMIENIKYKNEIAEIQKQLNAITEAEDVTQLKIICTGKIYPGTKITINNTTRNIDMELSNQKFFYSDGEIVIGAILTGEK